MEFPALWVFSGFGYSLGACLLQKLKDGLNHGTPYSSTTLAFVLLAKDLPGINRPFALWSPKVRPEIQTKRAK